MTDDVTIDTEELAEDPDVLPDEDGDQVDPTDVNENPDDLPGRIPARTVGGTHVQLDNQVTVDLGIQRGTSVTGTITVQEAAQDHTFSRGTADGAHIGGAEIGSSCDGQAVDCRIAAPQRIEY